MNYLSTDHLIVYAFLLVTLAIGLWAGRGIKDIKEYALGNRQFGTMALVLTYLATDIGGGSIIDDAGCIFSDGVILVAAFLGLVPNFIIRAFFIAPKMIHFSDCLTMGDVMEKLYGVPGKLLSGVLGFINATIVAGIQLIALGAISESLLGIRSIWGIGLGGLAMAAYSAYGGIKAVTVTDVFQFLVLAIVIPLIAGIAIEHAGGIKEIFTKVPPEKLQILEHEQFPQYLTLFLIWGIFQIGLIDPAIVQRLLMGRNRRQLQNQYLVIAAFDPAFRLAIMLIALSGVVLYPSVRAQDVVIHLFQELPAGVKGIAMAGLLGALMSTCDSYLHAAGITVARDIIKPISNSKETTTNELRWARYATLATGAGAILVALQAIPVMELVLIAAGLIGPLLMFPFVSGVVGLKTDQKSFYVAILSTLIAFGLSKLFLPATQSHLNILICIAANGIAFFGTHILQNKGLAIVQRTH